MPSRITSVGLHLTPNEFFQDTWLDTAKVGYRLNNREVALLQTSSTGTFWHKTDAGRRDCVWEHSNVFFPINFGGVFGTVTIAHFYSNTNYDIQNSGDRTLLTTFVTAAKTQAQMRLDPDGVGKYRYWYFTLNSANGLENPFVAEWGAVQDLSQPVEYGTNVVLSVESLDSGQERGIAVARKTTPTLSFIYATTVDGVSRYDISGAVITLLVAKTAALGRQGIYLIPSVTVPVDDGPLGEASVQLTELQTTLLPGRYSADVQIVKGGVKLRHVLPFLVTEALV